MIGLHLPTGDVAMSALAWTAGQITGESRRPVTRTARARILSLLERAGPQTADQIAAGIRANRQHVGRELRMLAALGTVRRATAPTPQGGAIWERCG